MMGKPSTNKSACEILDVYFDTFFCFITLRRPVRRTQHIGRAIAVFKQIIQFQSD